MYVCTCMSPPRMKRFTLYIYCVLHFSDLFNLRICVLLIRYIIILYNIIFHQKKITYVIICVGILCVKIVLVYYTYK